MPIKCSEHRCYKLNESTDTFIPAHFKTFVENVTLEKSTKKQIAPQVKLEVELAYCTALTVALELGFRLEKTKYPTKGFDLRAMKELTSLLYYRNTSPSGPPLSTVLQFPYLESLQFKLLTLPIFGDKALFNYLVMEDGVVKSSLGTIVDCGRHFITSKKGTNEFKDLKILSEIFMNDFYMLRNNALELVGVNYLNIAILPDELKRSIFLKLAARDFINLCLSSKAMWYFLKDENTWRFFLRRDFKVTTYEGPSYDTYQTLAIQGKVPANSELNHRNDSIPSEISFEFIDRGQFLSGN